MKLKKFVKQIAKMYASDEAAGQGFQKFYRLRQEDGWSELVRMIHIVQGLMAQQMLSAKFTDLSKEEKDIKQRTYAGLRVFLAFLENPAPELERAMFMAGHDKVIEERKRTLQSVSKGRK
jgi:hypothetical protein